MTVPDDHTVAYCLYSFGPLPASIASPSTINHSFIFQGGDRFQSLEAQYAELATWLAEKIRWFDAMHQSGGQAPMDYREYTIMLSEYRLKEELHERLRQLVEGNSQVVKYLFKKSNNKDANFQVGISADAWQELDTNWQKVAAQVLAFCLFSMSRND